MVRWIVLTALLMGSCFASPEEDIAVEAYIYGYPLITMDMTRKVMTNVVKPEGMRAPMGQFVSARTYPTPAFHDVTAPNADTLYSTAWLDLEKEPYVLHLPDQKGRYYLMPLLSGWTDVFASLGKRTTGTEMQDYVITGPNWQGELPPGVKEVKSPTDFVWILGRTYCTGTPEDYKAVHALQNQYTLTPLSAWGKPYTPPQGMVDPSVNMHTPVRTQVNQMSGAEFFHRLAELLIENPPAKEDEAIVAKMAMIGLSLGKPFDATKAGASIENAPKKGIQKIIAHQKEMSKPVNGWESLLKVGQYGTDYLQRALVAMIGLGANLAEDAIYPVAFTDSAGKPLNGSNRYIVHFDKSQVPPVKGFWSLTLYNDQFFFTENALNRYAISPRNNLKYNPDGSLDLYVQHESPGKEQESNWLPAPADGFILMLRLYWPEQAILEGKWTPPLIKKV